jgi:two-component system, sensor histidine kinase and response regulator
MSGEMSDLRRRAEERMARRRGSLHDWTNVGYELELTQAELDVQCEDLEQQRNELEAQRDEIDRLRLKVERVRDRYAALWDSAPVGILVLRMGTLIVEGNATAWCLLGQPSNDRTPLARFLDQSDADRLHLALARAERSVIEVRVRPARGAPFQALLVLEPAADQAGMFRAAIVETPSRAEDDRPAPATPLETTAVSILVADDNLGNRALATATLEDVGYRVIAASDGEEAIAQAAAHQPDCILMDIRMPKLDGITACERIRAMPGGGDVAILFVTAQRDVSTFDRALVAGGDDFITKPFRPDELLVRVHTALRLHKIATERSELSVQLKHQRDALQRLELQKEQLVAFLVHDLKNPVNAIDLHAQSAQRSADLERSHRAVAKIREDTRALLRMITNLLDISKADEGRLAPAFVAIDALGLVHDVLEELRARADAANVHLDSDVEVGGFQADRDLIARVLANLVDNAIRHAPEGGRVRVTIAPTKEGIELRVADGGAGVPPDERERVFERFLSGSTASRSNRGLGLAFCKLAVEAHGGRIWIEDGAPGAVFCVSLAQSTA